jgi:hypothetical protein
MEVLAVESPLLHRAVSSAVGQSKRSFVGGVPCERNYLGSICDPPRGSLLKIPLANLVNLCKLSCKTVTLMLCQITRYPRAVPKASTCCWSSRRLAQIIALGGPRNSSPCSGVLRSFAECMSQSLTRSNPCWPLIVQPQNSLKLTTACQHPAVARDGEAMYRLFVTEE